MPKPTDAQDITFLLVRPRYAGNIGSTARAMKNMGFRKLVLVRPTVLPTHPEALRLAVGAADLLQKAEVYDTLEEAISGLQYLIGTSRRTGKYRNDFVVLPEIGPKIMGKQKIGILFGAEERGLTNKELAFCHLVAMIPSNPDFPSLNLAQSVVVVAYQLRLLAESGETKTKSTMGLATLDQVEGMYGHLERILEKIGFLFDGNTFHMMRSLRSLFGRTALTEREVRIFRGICRQIEWKMKNP